MLHRIPAATCAVILAAAGAACESKAADPLWNAPGKGDRIDAPRGWSGPYIGIHGGYADGEWDGELLWNGGDAGFDDPNQAISADGWFGGAQIGYNFQRDRIVFGIEADVSRVSGFDGAGTWTAHEGDGGNAWRKEHDLSLEYFGTARLRLGYATGAFLPYITGGFAWAVTTGDLAVTQFAESDGAEAGTSFADVDETHVGWTIGGGLEVLLDEHWSAKAEYLYIDLDEQDYVFTGKTFTGADFSSDSYKSDLGFHSVRFGLNYQF